MQLVLLFAAVHEPFGSHSPDRITGHVSKKWQKW
jgi:hypothetical protein